MMNAIEKLSNHIATQMAVPLNLGEDQQEVVAYGAFILLQSTISILLLIILGLLFDLLWEILIISFSATILKKSSGGAHASSPYRCAVLGGIIFLILSFLLKKIVGLDYQIPWVMEICFFGITYLTINKYAPVDSPNKPINQLKMKNHLKKQSKAVVLISFLLTIFIVLTYLHNNEEILFMIGLGIQMGQLWQALTLLPMGSRLIESLDKVLKVVIS